MMRSNQGNNDALMKSVAELFKQAEHTKFELNNAHTHDSEIMKQWRKIRPAAVAGGFFPEKLSSAKLLTDLINRNKGNVDGDIQGEYQAIVNKMREKFAQNNRWDDAYAEEHVELTNHTAVNALEFLLVMQEFAAKCREQNNDYPSFSKLLYDALDPAAREETNYPSAGGFVANVFYKMYEACQVYDIKLDLLATTAATASTSSTSSTSSVNALSKNENVIFQCVSNTIEGNIIMRLNLGEIVTYPDDPTAANAKQELANSIQDLLKASEPIEQQAISSTSKDQRLDIINRNIQTYINVFTDCARRHAESIINQSPGSEHKFSEDLREALSAKNIVMGNLTLNACIDNYIDAIRGNISDATLRPVVHDDRSFLELEKFNNLIDMFVKTLPPEWQKKMALSSNQQKNTKNPDKKLTLVFALANVIESLKNNISSGEISCDNAMERHIVPQMQALQTESGIQHKRGFFHMPGKSESNVEKAIDIFLQNYNQMRSSSTSKSSPK